MRPIPTLISAFLSFLAIWLLEIGPYLLPGSHLENWFIKFNYSFWGTILRPLIAYLAGFAVGAFISVLLEDWLKFRKIAFGSPLSIFLIVVGTVISYLLLKQI